MSKLQTLQTRLQAAKTTLAVNESKLDEAIKQKVELETVMKEQLGVSTIEEVESLKTKLEDELNTAVAEADEFLKSVGV